MRIAKKTIVKSSVFNTASISLGRPEKKDLKQGQYIEYKCFATHGDIDYPAYSLQIPYFSVGTP